MADLLFGLPWVTKHELIDITIAYYFTAIKSFALPTELAEPQLNTIPNLIEMDLQRKTNCYYALKPIDQVLIALQFYTSCGLLQVVGDTTGVDKSTVFISRRFTCIP